MNIHIATSVGAGKTTLGAFDSALFNAGIANYNLLLLSSVIPPSTQILTHEATGIPSDVMPGDWGDRLYVVMAQQRVDIPGEEAWAGIGWVQDEATGKGLFVEHEGQASEAELRQTIEDSLKTLMHTRGIDFGKINMRVSGAVCKDEPVCAMVVAVYQSSDWHNIPTLMG